MLISRTMDAGESPEADRWFAAALKVAVDRVWQVLFDESTVPASTTGDTRMAAGCQPRGSRLRLVGSNNEATGGPPQLRKALRGRQVDVVREETDGAASEIRDRRRAKDLPLCSFGPGGIYRRGWTPGGGEGSPGCESEGVAAGEY